LPRRFPIVPQNGDYFKYSHFGSCALIR